MGALEEDMKYIANYDLPYEQLKGHTILITGATGLIGVSLIRALLSIGHIRILGLVRNIDKANGIIKENKQLKYVIGDITDSIDIEGEIDFIFHCAAVTTSKYMVEKPVETIWTSIKGTKNILELSRIKNIKSLVYISSMEMYGSFVENNKDVTENDLGYIDPLMIRSNYPESKRMCENMCIAYKYEYNVPVKIARLSQTFGAGILKGEKRVFAQFARSVINGNDIVLHTKGLSEGNYCYTRDCMIALLIILLLGEIGEAYNVVNPETHTTIANMANMVAEKIANGKIRVIYDIPEKNEYGYANDTKLRMSSDKLQKLGWKPEIGLEEAYRRMIDEWKNPSNMFDSDMYKEI